MRSFRQVVVLLLFFIACSAPAQQYPTRQIRSFTPAALVGESPNALVIHPRVPANSIQELIALARSKPGGLNICFALSRLPLILTF